MTKPITNTTSEHIKIDTKEQRKQLEDRLWLDSTLTQFDDLLRLNFNKSLADFSDVIIFHISKLLGAVRSSFFTVDNEAGLITVSGTYGTLIKNMKAHQFEVGEGPVGQAVKSKEILYFDDLPMHNAVVQTSLASINSTFLIIIPLIFNEVVYGVVELSILKRPEDKYLDLLTRLSKNVASMLQSIQTNQKTKKLLQEAQQQAEMLRAQEEEMRQNMEELTATQEEMERKQKELERNNKRMAQNEAVLRKSFEKVRLQEQKMKDALEKAHQMEVEAQSTMEEMRAVQAAMKQNEYELSIQVKAINENMATLSLNLDRQILTANEIFLELLGYTLAEIQGQPYEFLVDKKVIHAENYEDLWEILIKDYRSVRGQFKFRAKDKKSFWLRGSFTPIKSPMGEVVRMMLYGVDVTGQKLHDKSMQKLLEEAKNQNEIMKAIQEELDETRRIEATKHQELIHKYETSIQNLKRELAELKEKV